MNAKIKSLGMAEFVILLAAMISIVALATDVMLPALDVIGAELGVTDPNDAQLVISSLFLGFAVGQLVAGPLSDSFGRKPVIYLGYAIFIIGCLLSLYATNWSMMIVGRVLQGLGAASPRIVTLALVRDSYSGRSMARIMSITMSVFILVPAIAPALGQVVIFAGGWQATFVLLIVTAFVTGLWFMARQPETLLPEKRIKFSLRSIGQGTLVVCASRVAMGYTIATGLIFGAFLGYLSTAQQVFQITFQSGNLFAVYFALAALAIGAASVVNSLLVMRLGMRALTWWAMIGVTVLAIGFLVIVQMSEGVPSFALFMVWLLASFFCVGILFGNMNAIAMEPLGAIAGLGAALVGSISNFIALPLGWVIGDHFDGGVTSLVMGFAVLGAASLGVVMWAERGPNAEGEQA